MSFFTRKRKIILFSVLGFIVVIVFLILSIYGPWWRIWPAGIRFNIALNRLAISVYENPYCRLDCQLYQLGYKKEIEGAANKKRASKKLIKIILNEDENLSWRIELIKLTSRNNNPHQDMLDAWQRYIDSDSLDFSFKKHIVKYFREELDLSNYIDKLKIIAVNNYYQSNERILAIRELSSLDYIFSDFYFSLLKTEKDELIIMALLRSLGADDGRFNLDRETLFNTLDNIIRVDNYSPELRRLIVFILSDFLSYYSSVDIEKLFEKLIFSGEIDKFTRYLIVESFNQYSNKNYDLPEISASDWSDYWD